MSESTADLRKLRQQMRLMKDEARLNESLLRKSQQRELDILTAGNLRELFKRLTRGLADSFAVDQVTLVLCDPDHEIRHLLIAEGGSGKTTPPDVKFFDALTGVAPQYASLHRPWLGAYRTADHQLVFGRDPYQSIAMIGLRRQDKLIGSLNLASRDPDRYRRGLASDFLAHLGVIASFALENTVNRARLLRSGFTDVLTGWHNRRYLQLRLAEELSRARREKTSLSCLFLDLDHFKRVNDEHGHHAGDIVLAECAHRIDAEVRSSDVAARYGGEEFVILLPATEVDDAMLLAERIREAVSATPIALPDDEPLKVTVSIGVAGLRPADEEGDNKSVGERLLKMADLAMYSAKSSGRDRVARAV